MNSIQTWKQRFCNTCPVLDKCDQSKLEILNCALSKLATLNDKPPIQSTEKERESSLNHNPHQNTIKVI